MMRALAFAGLLGLAACPASADDTCPAFDLDALIDDLSTWIAGHSDLRTDRLRAVVPDIIFCAPHDHVAYDDGELIVEDDMLAAYDLAARRIYLVEPWQASDPRAVSTLLHELVHAAQFDSREWECAQATEWQAYQLQAAWLAEHGIETEYDWAAIALRSLCPSEVHP